MISTKAKDIYNQRSEQSKRRVGMDVWMSPKTSFPSSSSSGNSIRPSARHSCSDTSNEFVGQSREPPAPKTTSQVRPVKLSLHWQVKSSSVDWSRRLEPIGVMLGVPGCPILSTHWPPFEQGQLAHGPAGAVAHFASASVLQCAHSKLISEKMFACERQPPFVTNASTHTLHVRRFAVATTPNPRAI